MARIDPPLCGLNSPRYYADDGTESRGWYEGEA